MERTSAHIIFDLKGVLVEKDLERGYSIIQAGRDIFEQCRSMKDSQGKQLHKLYALSNVKEEVLLRWKSEFHHIFNYFDGIIISEHVGYKKPDHRIFQHFLQTYQLQPQACIFIDDSIDNVIAAQQLGFIGLECADHSQVKEGLKKMKII